MTSSPQASSPVLRNQGQPNPAKMVEHLKQLIKTQLKSLIDELEVMGEQTVVVMTNIYNNTFDRLGSTTGEKFLSTEFGGRGLEYKFKSYCMDLHVCYQCDITFHTNREAVEHGNSCHSNMLLGAPRSVLLPSGGKSSGEQIKHIRQKVKHLHGLDDTDSSSVLETGSPLDAGDINSHNNDSLSTPVSSGDYIKYTSQNSSPIDMSLYGKQFGSRAAKLELANRFHKTQNQSRNGPHGPSHMTVQKAQNSEEIGIHEDHLNQCLGSKEDIESCPDFSNYSSGANEPTGVYRSSSPKSHETPCVPVSIVPSCFPIATDDFVHFMQSKQDSSFPLEGPLEKYLRGRNIANFSVNNTESINQLQCSPEQNSEKESDRESDLSVDLGCSLDNLDAIDEDIHLNDAEELSDELQSSLNENKRKESGNNLQNISDDLAEAVVLSETEESPEKGCDNSSMKVQPTECCNAEEVHGKKHNLDKEYTNFEQSVGVPSQSQDWLDSGAGQKQDVHNIGDSEKDQVSSAVVSQSGKEMESRRPLQIREKSLSRERTIASSSKRHKEREVRSRPSNSDSGADLGTIKTEPVDNASLYSLENMMKSLSGQSGIDIRSMAMGALPITRFVGPAHTMMATSAAQNFGTNYPGDLTTGAGQSSRSGDIRVWEELSAHNILHSDQPQMHMPRIREPRLGKNKVFFEGQKGENGPYYCSLCGKSFQFRSWYKFHERTHVEVRPYVCDVCHKPFKDKETLKRHCRIHSGERPYVCDLCGRAFNHTGTLSNHKKRHRLNMMKQNI